MANLLRGEYSSRTGRKKMQQDALCIRSVLGCGEPPFRVAAVAADIRRAAYRLQDGTIDQEGGAVASVEAKRRHERDRAWCNSQDLLVICDKQGVIQAVNPAWTKILGWQPDELVRRQHREFIDPADHATSADALITAAIEGLPPYENRMRHKDGSVRWIAWVASQDQGLIYASGRHITPEKEAAQARECAREQSRQSPEIPAIGQVAGELAHELNNILAGILGSLEMLECRIAAERFDGLDRYTTMAATSAQRAAALTQRLLAFARPQPLDPKPVEAD